jgi:type IV pilus assembly protein PilQ
MIGLLLCVCAFLFAADHAMAQERFPVRNYTAPEKMLSMDGKTGFKQAMEIFGNAFQRFEQRPLIYEGDDRSPIGVNIENMYWRDAFDLVLRITNHWYVDNKEYVKVVSLAKGKEKDSLNLTAAKAVSTREVEISAIFFEANRTQLEQAGIDWSFGNTSPNATTSTSITNTGAVQYGVNSNLHAYTNSLDLRLIIKALQAENIGELISCPSITVRSGEQGRIQVGQDFSIKQQDFSGNTIDRFYSTGTIIEVTPTIMKKDSTEFVHLKISAERSSVIPDALSTIVNKTVASTSVILIDGEETVVGGLFTNDIEKIRRGVPVLKDLPWFFFGLRYLFGYDDNQVVKKELIIILKARLVPSLEDRLAEKVREIQSATQNSLQSETERIEAVRKDLIRQVENARKSNGEKSEK